MDLIVYEKSTCSKCQLTEEILRSMRLNFKTIEYYNNPLTHQKLQELITKMRIKPKELLRTEEELYKELRIAEKKLSDGEVIDLMIQHPDLMQRPIIEYGKKAVLGRPPEKVKELF